MIRRFPDETGLQHQLTLYVRRGCHLCTDMAQALERLRPAYGFDYREVDIDADPKLARRYGTRVPVLAEGATEQAAGLEETSSSVPPRSVTAFWTSNGWPGTCAGRGTGGCCE